MVLAQNTQEEEVYAKFQESLVSFIFCSTTPLKSISSVDAFPGELLRANGKHGKRERERERKFGKGRQTHI